MVRLKRLWKEAVHRPHFIGGQRDIGNVTAGIVAFSLKDFVGIPENALDGVLNGGHKITVVFSASFGASKDL